MLSGSLEDYEDLRVFYADQSKLKMELGYHFTKPLTQNTSLSTNLRLE